MRGSLCVALPFLLWCIRNRLQAVVPMSWMCVQTFQRAWSIGRLKRICIWIPPLPQVLEPQTFPASCPPASLLSGALLLLWRQTYHLILFCFIVLGIKISGHQTKGQLEWLVLGNLWIGKSLYTCLGSESFSVLYKLYFWSFRTKVCWPVMHVLNSDPQRLLKMTSPLLFFSYYSFFGF